MTVNSKDLEQLQNIPVPEEREFIRQQTLQLALSEFDSHQMRKKHGLSRFFSLSWLVELGRNLTRSSQLIGALAGVFIIAIASTIYLSDIDPEKQPDQAAKPVEIGEVRSRMPEPEPKPVESAEKSRKRSFSTGGRTDRLASEDRETTPEKDKAVSMNRAMRPAPLAREEKAQPTSIDTGNFSNPLHRNLPVHFCLDRTESCGQQAADAFCRQKGFQRASRFVKAEKNPEKTISIKDNTAHTATGSFQPETFSLVSCTNR